MVTQLPCVFERLSAVGGLSALWRDWSSTQSSFSGSLWSAKYSGTEYCLPASCGVEDIHGCTSGVAAAASQKCTWLSRMGMVGSDIAPTSSGHCHAYCSSAHRGSAGCACLYGLFCYRKLGATATEACAGTGGYSLGDPHDAPEIDESTNTSMTGLMLCCAALGVTVSDPQTLEPTSQARSVPISCPVCLPFGFNHLASIRHAIRPIAITAGLLQNLL